MNPSRTVRWVAVFSWMLVEAVLSPPGHAQAPDKLDFTLRRILEEGRDGRDCSGSTACSEKAGVPYLAFFAELSEAPADLSGMDVEVLARAGTTILASAPLDRIRDLSLLPEVVRLEGASPGTFFLDLSVPDIRADEVWDDPALGWDRGEGVVVGMADSGINLEHRAFQDDAGNSRIRYVWDMTDASGPAPAEDVCGYWDETGAWVSRPCGGTECGPQEIAGGTCRETDLAAPGTLPHGTAVMGTQAANWFACDAQDPGVECRGVAPLSDIVAVKMPSAFYTVDVAQGASYIFAKAQALDQAAVVNLSVGFYYGPRDGSSVFEQFMSNLVDPALYPYGPPRILVAAAGNEGLEDEHAELSLSEVSPLGTVYANMPGRLGGERTTHLEGWYSYDGDQEVRVRLLRKFFQQPDVLIDWLTFGESESYEKPVVGPLYGGMLSFTESTGTARGFVLELWSKEQATWEYQIELFVEEAGEQESVVVDLWIDPLATTSYNGEPDFTFKPQSVSPAKTIVPPCTADGVVCVSSYNTRCPDGYCNQPLGGTLKDGDETFSAFSSRGPRRDGVLKPEIGAPGQALVVPASPGETTYGYYAVGTSFSSPHVAGTVALLMRNRPDLTPIQIVQGLEGTARPWKITEEQWTQQTEGYRGVGRLDAYALVDRLSTLPVPPSGLTAALVRGNYVQLAWQASPSEDVVAYNIYSSGGTGEMNYETAIGRVPAGTLAWVTPQPLPAGRYLFGVRAENADGDEDKNRSVVTVYLTPQLFGEAGDDDFCFIASAAFRDPRAPAVNRLRAFRDRFLMPHAWGRALVRGYYRVSPPVAEWLKGRSTASVLVRTALLPAVGIAEVLVHRPLLASGVAGALFAACFCGCLLLARPLARPFRKALALRRRRPVP